MPIASRKALRTLAAVLAIAVLWPLSGVYAQATLPAGAAPSRVLPTGGRQALLDPVDGD